MKKQRKDYTDFDKYYVDDFQESAKVERFEFVGIILVALVIFMLVYGSDVIRYFYE